MEPRDSTGKLIEIGHTLMPIKNISVKKSPITLKTGDKLKVYRIESDTVVWGKHKKYGQIGLEVQYFKNVG